MAKHTDWSKDFDCSTEVLLGVLVDPAFHIARSDLLENPSCKVKEISRSDDRLEFEVHCTEYGKGVKGIDRSKTEQTMTSYKWDLKRMRSDWVYTGGQAKRVRVWGDMVVTERGGGCHLDQQFNVEIKIPLVGGQIEKLVIKESAKFWPKYEKLIKDFIAKAS